MKIPKIQGIIRRRILLNYRCDPEVVQKLLPTGFRPKCVEGFAIAGICMIRLEEIRPKGLPAWVGISSENTAHRIAVEWRDGVSTKEGVFVPRRDTGSKCNHFAGGRIFPGVHHLAKFDVKDEEGELRLKVLPKRATEVLVDLHVDETSAFPEDSIFPSIEASSEFFEAGCVGYSSRPNSCVLDGLTLHVPDWQVSALHVRHVASSYFDNPELFPTESITLDHALLMRDISHEWRSEPEMRLT